VTASRHRHTLPPQNLRNFICLFISRIAFLTSHRKSHSCNSDAPGRHHSSGFLIVAGRPSRFFLGALGCRRSCSLTARA
jgi:hypothetical protein